MPSSASRRRSRDARTCRALAGWAGRSSPQSAASRTSADTTRPAERASTARSARSPAAGGPHERPSTTTSTGPSSRTCIGSSRPSLPLRTSSVDLRSSPDKASGRRRRQARDSGRTALRHTVGRRPPSRSRPEETEMTSTRHPAEPSAFPTDPTGLEPAGPPADVPLSDGDDFPMRIGPVAGRVGADTVRMLAYNGSVPGPTLRVAQHSEVTVRVCNDGDDEATVHWHGLRLDNAYDGVPYETQQPIPIGGEYTYRLRFPDPGLYWYHPHVREDHGLEMGLYGAIVVDPAEPDYWPPADRDLVVTVDDVLIEDGAIAPFSRTGIDHVAMGRFGNVLLTAGRTDWTAAVRTGGVVRLHLVNTANTRLFNVAVAGAPMKLIGGDSGRYEHETFVEEVLLAPSERAIVDVLFDGPGRFPLEHRTPDRPYPLGTVEVTGEPSRSCPSDFGATRTAPEMTAERDRIQAHRARPPDKT